MDAKQLESLTQEQLMNLFVEQMIKDKGVEATVELKNELMDRIVEKINLVTVQSLPDEYLKKLNAELDAETATEESVAKLVDDARVDMEAVTERALKMVRAEYLDGTARPGVGENLNGVAGPDVGEMAKGKEV